MSPINRRTAWLAVLLALVLLLALFFISPESARGDVVVSAAATDSVEVSAATWGHATGATTWEQEIFTAFDFDNAWYQPQNNTDGVQPNRSGTAATHFWGYMIFEHDGVTLEQTWVHFAPLLGWDGDSVIVNAYCYKAGMTTGGMQAVFSTHYDSYSANQYLYGVPDTTAAYAVDMPGTGTSRVFMFADTLIAPWNPADLIWVIGLKRLQNDAVTGTAGDNAGTDIGGISVAVQYKREY